MGNALNTKKIIEETSSQHYNVRDEYKNNTIEENKLICENDRLSYAVGALSITGDLNIGMMIRTASLLGAKDFFIFGRRKFDKRSTVGAQNYINIHKLDMSIDDISNVCNMYDYHPIFIEHGGNELPFSYSDWEDVSESIWATNPLFIFGSESDGIPTEILDGFPDSPILSLPQWGVLRSFNVSSTMAIVCWDYVSKYGAI